MEFEENKTKHPPVKVLKDVIGMGDKTIVKYTIAVKVFEVLKEEKTAKSNIPIVKHIVGDKDHQVELAYMYAGGVKKAKEFKKGDILLIRNATINSFNSFRLEDKQERPPNLNYYHKKTFITKADEGDDTIPDAVTDAERDILRVRLLAFKISRATPAVVGWKGVAVTVSGITPNAKMMPATECSLKLMMNSSKITTMSSWSLMTLTLAFTMSLLGGVTFIK